MKKLFLILMASGFFNANAQRVKDPSLEEDTSLCRYATTSFVDVTDMVQKLFPKHPKDFYWHAKITDPFVFYRRESHGDSVVIACLVHNRYDSAHRLICQAWEEIDRITIFYYVYDGSDTPKEKIVYSLNLASRSPVRWIGQMCADQESKLRVVYKYTTDVLEKIN